MTITTSAPDEQDHPVQLSRRLVALHVGGIVLLIGIVIGTAVWISEEHNRLARTSSVELVGNEIESLRGRAYTLIKDYSIWTEAYEAVLAGDVEWLFSNIGSSVTEIGTFDLAMMYLPGSGPAFGWVSGSPPEGQTDILPADILEAILDQLSVTDVSSVATRTLVAEFQGVPWFFAASRLTPTSGTPAGVSSDELPRQIHGLRLTRERLDQIGFDLLATDLSLSQTVPPGSASYALTDFRGDVITHVVWDAPTPGASILRKVAFPLVLALGVATAISGVSSLFAVRSARRLEDALYDAKAADRSKSEFISNISHELRTPMNGVLGATQLLQTTELDPEQRDLVSVLMSSAAAQMSLISDLIDLSRIDAGRRMRESHPFEPAGIVKEVGDMMQVAASTKGIRLDVDHRAVAGVALQGDAQAFRQVLTNLIGNAVKFTETGSVTVRAGTAPAPGGRRELSVVIEDTGPGIPDTALPRIFERFFQVDGSMTRATVGTGLGLAISQKLAESMGGRIEVSSEIGRGSSFRFSALFEDRAEAPEARDAA